MARIWYIEGRDVLLGDRGVSYCSHAKGVIHLVVVTWPTKFSLDRAVGCGYSLVYLDDLFGTFVLFRPFSCFVLLCVIRLEKLQFHHAFEASRRHEI